MAQHDYDIANAAGAPFRADINAVLAAAVSNNSAATAPPTTFAYMWWADTTAGLLKQRNAANSGWISVLTLATGLPVNVSPRATRIDVASVAGTVDLTTSAPDTDDIRLTGALAIMGFTIAVGRVVRVVASAASSLANNASIVTQTGATLTLAAGNSFMLRATAANVVEVLGLTRAAASSAQIQTIPTPTLAANALTIPSIAFTLDFRSATLNSPTITTVSGSPAAIVVPAGATLGTVSGIQSDIYLLALNNAGTLEYALVNASGSVDLSETGVISTTAIGAGSTSASIVYSTTARTGVAYRVVGVIRSTQTTAGQWAQAQSLLQGVGGQALAAMSSLGYGQTWQNVVGSRANGTTYYNLTGKPIFINVITNTGAASLTINGVSLFGQTSGSGTNSLTSAIVPVSASYSVTGGTLTSWAELR